MNGQHAEKELAEAITESKRNLEKAHERYNELQHEYDSLLYARDVLRKRRAPTIREQRRRDDPVPISSEELAGKSQVEMLTYIAQRNDGRIKSAWARRFVVAAGAFKDPENASVGIYKILSTSPRFESVSRGVYRLVPKELDAVDQKEEPRQTLSA